jgi:hypothetical protein
MKNKLFMLFGLFAFLSCDVTSSAVSGIENKSYLIFLAADKTDYPNGVEVSLNDSTIFNAEVHKNISRVRNLLKYGVSSGKHKIKVVKDGNLLYEKLIFVSPGQTKKIILQ